MKGTGSTSSRQADPIRMSCELALAAGRPKGASRAAAPWPAATLPLTTAARSASRNLARTAGTEKRRLLAEQKKWGFV